MNARPFTFFLLLAASLVSSQAQEKPATPVVLAALIVQEGSAAKTAPAPKPAGPNLLKNPDFAQGAEGWKLVAWGKIGRMAVDQKESRNGKMSLRIDNPQGDHTFVDQVVAVKPHTRYELAGFIKTKDVESAKSNSLEGARLVIGPGFAKTPQVQRSKDWTRVTQEFATRDEVAVEVGMSLGYFSDFMTGTAWFSELSMTELGPLPSQKE